VSAAGWIAAAALFVWATASGHAVAGLGGAQKVGEFVLAVADTGAGAVTLVRGLRQADRPTRAERRAAQRAAATGQRPGVKGWLRRSPRVRWLHDTAARLPRPVGRMLIAGYWTSVAVCCWQLIAAMLGGLAATDSTAQGQQLAASVAMLHLIVWCSLACATLSRRRGGLRPGQVR
jgi:hypothetical protein